MMKNPNFERCVLVLKMNPFELGTIVFFSSFHTLVILLQIDPASSDEPYTVCESCYEIENTSIFAWSSIPDVGHYH